MPPNSRQPRKSIAGRAVGSDAAEQPCEAEARAFNCAGVGDPNELAWICYECANCLCKPEKWMQMPEYALANLLFLGRQHPLLQKHGTLGLRLLLGLGIPCFRKLLLGKGSKEERESGLLGNHVLLSQPAAQLGKELPPSAESLSNNFVALFGRSPEDVRKCQILKVNRQAYVTLVRERVQVNPVYHDVVLDQAAVAKLPEADVPQQIWECACPLLGSDRYRATSIGPGTLRDPMNKSHNDEEASDEEMGDEEQSVGHEQGAEQECGAHEQCAEQPVEEELNQRETPLGLDPTATPSYVQHLAAFQMQLREVETACRETRKLQERKENGDQDNIGAATAAAAAEEMVQRKIIDLKQAAQELSQVSFEAKAKELEGVDTGLFVPTQAALSMFDSATWTKCCPQFWFGDALPDQDRPRRITFEQLFLCLLDREELQYDLDSDVEPYIELRRKAASTNPTSR